MILRIFHALLVCLLVDPCYCSVSISIRILMIDNTTQSSLPMLIRHRNIRFICQSDDNSSTKKIILKKDGKELAPGSTFNLTYSVSLASGQNLGKYYCEQGSDKSEIVYLKHMFNTIADVFDAVHCGAYGTRYVITEGSNRSACVQFGPCDCELTVNCKNFSPEDLGMLGKVPFRYTCSNHHASNNGSLCIFMVSNFDQHNLPLFLSHDAGGCKHFYGLKIAGKLIEDGMTNIYINVVPGRKYTLEMVSDAKIVNGTSVVMGYGDLFYDTFPRRPGAALPVLPLKQLLSTGKTNFLFFSVAHVEANRTDKHTLAYGFNMVLYDRNTFPLNGTVTVLNRTHARYRCQTKHVPNFVVCVAMDTLSCTDPRQLDKVMVQIDLKDTDDREVVCRLTVWKTSFTKAGDQLIPDDDHQSFYLIRNGTASAKKAEEKFFKLKLGIAIAVGVTGLLAIIAGIYLLTVVRGRRSKEDPWITEAKQDQSQTVSREKTLYSYVTLEKLLLEIGQDNEQGNQKFVEQVANDSQLSFISREWVLFTAWEGADATSGKSDSERSEAGSASQAGKSSKPTSIVKVVAKGIVSIRKSRRLKKKSSVIMLELGMAFVTNLRHKKCYVLGRCPMREETDQFFDILMKYRLKMVVSILTTNDIVDKNIFPYFMLTSRATNSFGSYVLQCVIATEDNDDYCIRHIVIAKNGSNNRHEFVHIHFKGWPESERTTHVKAPVRLKRILTPLVPKIVTEDSAILFQCTSAVGRASMLLTSLVVFEWLDNYGWPINMLMIVKHVNRQYPNAINTIQQYAFLYCAAGSYVKSRQRRIFAKLASPMRTRRLSIRVAQSMEKDDTDKPPQ